MKFPTPWRCGLFASCLAASLIFTACHKTPEHTKIRRESAALPSLEWNLKTLVDAYDQDGHSNPRWDETAKRALTELARARSRSTETNEDWALIISNNCTAAVDAGCDDPMISYLHARYCMDQSADKQVFADAFLRAADGMEKSSYPNIRKFYAWERAGQQVTYTYGYTNIPPEVGQLGIWQHAELHLLSALSDMTMPPEEIYVACHDLLDIWKGSNNHYPTLYHSMEDLFPNNWTNEPLLLLLKGQSYVQMAWLARGGGYANTVTRDGWKLFQEHLATAENALTNAWRLDPKDPRIAEEMIYLEVAQGQGRDRMELWFQRAMELNPNDYDACNYKLLYLEPKWYGSVPEMLAFGRECAGNEQWGGQVPLILMDAHAAIQREYVDDAQKTDYWKRPEVWPDLKNAFDRYFVVNPHATGWYHNYALYAFRAEQWAAFNALVPKLGTVNYNYFGGKDEFDNMVATAKERAGETKN